MSTISKSDKLIWENYIANFKSFSFNVVKTNKNLINQKKKTSLISKKKNFKREITSKPEGVIDLHGYRLHTAKIILHNYIVDAYERKIRNILIITGKGQNNTGALKKEVPIWLSNRTLINLLISYETAPKKFGGEGALLVRIKNKNKSQLK